jgi:putative membrane protein
MNGEERDDEKMDLAVRRTLLASERTFTAWIRTALSSVVAGIAVARFLTDQGTSWAGRAIAVMLILSGVALYVVAIWQYRKDRERFQSRGRATPVWLAEIVGFALLGASLLSLLLVF